MSTDTKPMTETTPATVEGLADRPALVDGRGNLLPITGEVYTSSAMPGMVAIEVEHGTLYADQDETLAVPTASAIPLTKPVTVDVLKKAYGLPGEDTVVVSVLVDLDDLIGSDLSAANEMFQGKVIGYEYVGDLMDLDYRVTGHQDGSVIVTITADASDLFSENLCINFDECEGTTDDGEGYDGECGNCADVTYAAENPDESDDEDEEKN